MQDRTPEIHAKMTQALILIKEALNISLPLLRGEQRQGVVALWEGFLREILTFIRKTSKESGLNLISYISFNRIWLR